MFIPNSAVVTAQLQGTVRRDRRFYMNKQPKRPISNRSLRRRLDRPVVLIGMMGSGKSTLGRRLAQRLELPFVDADDEIQRAAGMSISEIFQQFGEPYFRDGERRVIGRLLGKGHGVIATGGGAFIQDETRSAILEQAISIWLDVPTETLIERTARRTHRPLLQTGDPAETMRRMLEERRPYYAQAHIRVESGTAPHNRAVDSLIASLKEFLS